ncbi:MAG: hypothetical protein IPL39_12560 [Opitutaceae bacterium]|nr:hypothetical protein [Opitutaceae bacterium]
MIAILLGTMFSGLVFCETAAAISPASELIAKYAGIYCDSYNFCGPLIVSGSQLYAEQFYDLLGKTSDQELKRLLALTYLSAELESAISDLEKGIVREGKLPPRKMKKAEREPCKAHVRGMLCDLAVIDPSDPKKVIAELTARLDAAAKGRK